MLLIGAWLFTLVSVNLAVQYQADTQLAYFCGHFAAAAGVVV